MIDVKKKKNEEAEALKRETDGYKELKKEHDLLESKYQGLQQLEKSRELTAELKKAKSKDLND